MQKILLTGTYSSFNKGDAAMEISTAQSLLANCAGSSVCISSPFPQFDTEFYHPLPVVPCSRRRLIYASIKLARFWLWRILRPFFGRGIGFLAKDPEIQQYLEADLVVDLSGDMQTEDYGVHVTYSHYLPPLMTLIAQKPLFLCAQSIGPFKWTRPIARYILSRASSVTVRDSISLDYLEKMGINNNSLRMTADMAFLLKPAPDDEVDDLLQKEGISFEGKRVLGVSLSGLVQKKYNSLNPEAGSHTFEELIAGVLDEICAEYSLVPLFVSHVTGPSNSKNDRIISQKVASKMQQPALVLKGDYRPEQLKGIIRRCYCFLGARMHANIGALSSTIPVVAMAYSHKTPGIMKQFKQDHLVCRAEQFKRDDLLRNLHLVLEKRDEIAGILAQGLAVVQAEAQKNVEIASTLLKNSGDK